MSDKKAFSFEQLKNADLVEYDTVPVYGGEQRIGSLTAAQILEWVEENDDPVKRKEAGLRLIVRSVVDGEDNRIPESEQDTWIGVFKNKNPRQNGILVQRILTLNGLSAKAKQVVDDAKNASGETSSDASPSV